MNALNNLIQTYISPKGIGNSTQFFIGLLLMLFFNVLATHFDWPVALYWLIEAIFFGNYSEMGVLSILSEQESLINFTRGFSIIYEKLLVRILCYYIAFNCIYKYCKGFEIKALIAILLSFLICSFFWNSVGGYTILMIIMGDFPFYSQAVFIFYLISLIGGGSAIIYLFKRNTSIEISKTIKQLFLLGILAYLYYLLMNNINPLRNYIILKYILIVVPFFIVIGTYLYLVYPYVAKVFDNSKRIIPFYISYFAIICVHAGLIVFLNDSCPQFLWSLINSLLPILSSGVLLMTLLLLLPVGMSENMVRSDSEDLFSNRILNLLFSYKGKITSRDYRAMLILLFNTVVWIIAPSVLYMQRGHNVFTYSNHFIDIDFFTSLYIFVVTYSSIVLTVKRARAKELPKYAKWIFSAVVYSTFCVVLHSVSLALHLNDYSISMYPTLLILGIILLLGIACIIFLAIKNNYDFETESYGDDWTGQSSISFIYSMFNLGIIVGITQALIDTISAFSSYEGFKTLSIASVVVLMIYVVFYLKYAFGRALNANINKLWVVGFLLVSACIIVSYIFLDMWVTLYLLKALLIASFILVALPTYQKTEN